MARIRTVKPELFRHEMLYKLEQETGLPLRVAWIGLFTVVDREGRFKWKPNAIKLDVLPWDELDFETILLAFESIGLIQRYKFENEVYAYIPKWHLHQRVNAREAQSTIPAPETGESLEDAQLELIGSEACTTMHVHARGEGKGREGKGKRIDDESPPPSPMELFDLWNEICVHLVKAEAFSEKRKTSARCRLADNPDIEYWRSIFTKMNSSGFCRGENERGWRADIDFALRPDTHVRVLEGKYDTNKKSSTPTNDEARRRSF